MHQIFATQKTAYTSNMTACFKDDALQSSKIVGDNGNFSVPLPSGELFTKKINPRLVKGPLVFNGR